MLTMKNIINSKVADVAKLVAVKVAKHYANVTCPFLTYQPIMNKEVKLFHYSAAKPIALQISELPINTSYESAKMG